ncbi:hypothetical protein SELMODRAFT_409480 [Selaginella moellendorffii]|uniref:HIG1 domain-containing protein n=1 Tax=Selaginella moellendorffii TaxID=88036 RepID=D8RBK8_SELML|nr:uncharacterized protein LOC9650501 [Selaginella moellendorffii]EFJ30814.1 hypothetical protein SELMODRAFT_409480 [Selaginella moellendorffii]|eukprot:XP_002968560.1 uncharacterized protein LOC9650501 [Selaginella moellendorffii]
MASLTMSRGEESISSGSGGSTVSRVSSWVRENKLKTIGTFWGTTLGSSILWNLSKPHEKLSLKLLHARVHAQGVTLMALAGAGFLEYLDRREKNNLKLAAAAQEH